MTARQVIGALAGVGLIVLVLYLLFLLGILLPILAVLGLALFLLVVIALVVFVVLSIVLVPYYFFTKRPNVETGSYRLEDVKEK
ncbi:MAG: hypothetical protein ACE5JE_08820 [Thermoplasmata archaeon]